jgi:hypothetical protein|tara:strand:+ start:615 stop:959 length:345 start_codon:yes stop_codon:yes gene_type:complete
MNYGLDLIMNKNKVKKKKYNLEKVNQTKFIDFIRDTIYKELDLKDTIDSKKVEKIIRMSIDIYKQNTKIPIDKLIEKNEIKLDFVPGEPVKNITLPDIKIKEDNKINVDVTKLM